MQCLLSAAEDLTEPRLPMLAGQPVIAADDGSGYIVFRVAKSHSGPHRLKTTREFYIRRGERAAVMDVREIKDLTLNLARSGDRIEALFAERSTNASHLWAAITVGRLPFHSRVLLIRVTGVPLIARSIPQLTSRRDLWWTGRAFDVKINTTQLNEGYPSREFNNYVKPRIRSLEMQPQDTLSGPRRLLRYDGVVEFGMTRKLQDDRERNGALQTQGTDIFFDWVGQLAAGAFCQIEVLRRSLGWGEIPYGIEVEIRGLSPLTLFLGGSREESEFGRLLYGETVILPRLEVRSRSEFDAVLGAILLDASNAFQEHWETTVTAPWDRLLPPT